MNGYLTNVSEVSNGQNQLIKIVSEIVGKDVKFEYVKDRLGHDRKYALDISKYNDKFGTLDYIDLKEWLTKIIG